PPSPPLRPVAPLLCSKDSSVLPRHPTPHHRSCRSYGYCLLRPDCPSCWQPTMRSPGSRACSFSACLGSTTTWDRSQTRAYRLPTCSLPLKSTGSASQFGFFEARYPAHRCLCLRFTSTPRDVHGKTRGQVGSLLLSCRTLSFPTACRFYPGARTFPLQNSQPCRPLLSSARHIARSVRISAGLLHFSHANATESVSIVVSMIGFATFSASSPFANITTP